MGLIFRVILRADLAVKHGMRLIKCQNGKAHAFDLAVHCIIIHNHFAAFRFACCSAASLVLRGGFVHDSDWRNPTGVIYRANP